jgi:O-antigen/teichoic acid export membrane protein
LNNLPDKSALKRNVVANLAGRAWSGVLSIVAVPIFYRLLGAEAYGLVGLFASLQVIFTFLDFGLSSTVNREIARNITMGRSPSVNRNLLRTFEAIYWPVGFAIGVLILAGAGWISTNLVNVQRLSLTEVQLAIAITAGTIAVRWPVSLYTGVLQGLQKQVLQNVVFIGAGTLRTLGALAVVAWFSQTITAFLLAQAAASVVEVSIYFLLSWGSLNRGSSDPVCFRADLLRGVWRFALSFNAVGVLGVAVSNVDRIVIGKYLPLPQLGYYAIASTAAGIMPLISYAVMTAIFPRFSAHAAAGDRDSLSRNYHRSVQAIAFPAVAISMAVVFFSRDILLLWTRSEQVAREAWVVLALLSAANLFAALLNPSFTVLMAFGYTKVPLLMNTVNALFWIPAMFLLVPNLGIEAAAAIWLTQNIVVLFVYSNCANKVVLHEKPRWFFSRDVLVYIVSGLLWLGGGRLLTPSGTGTATTLLSILVATVGYGLSIILVTRTVPVFPHGLVIWTASKG